MDWTAGAGARMAGNGGIGEGERPRPRAETLSAGDPGAWEEKEERRELVPLCPEPGGGGFIKALVLGVEGTEIELGVGGGCGWEPGAAGAEGCSVISEAVVTTDPASDVVDPRRTREGRDTPGIEGVLEWRISMREGRDTGWTSATPLRNANVLTWTALASAYLPNG
jgi:hypothetical protein